MCFSIEIWMTTSLLRVFGQLSSSLLLFPQRFGRYVFQPSAGACRTREPSRNFELHLLLNPRGSPVPIPLAITGYKCKVFLYCYSPLVRIEPATSRWLSPYKLREPTPITLKKAGGQIGRNIVEITIKMKAIVLKPLMIKINQFRLRNLDN